MGLPVVLSAVKREVAFVFGLEGASRLGAAEFAVGRVGNQMDFERCTRRKALLQEGESNVMYVMNRRGGVLCIEVSRTSTNVSNFPVFH